jgi:hypothetical protein
MLKPEQLQKLICKTLAVKEYIGVQGKKQLVNSIFNECILYDHGIYKFDEIQKYICFTMKTIEAYTNLELSDDIENDYDVLCQTGFLDLIIECFKNEYDNVHIFLQMRTNYFLNENTVEAQVARVLDEFLEKIDDIIDNIINGVENFDISKLPIQKSDLQELFQLITQS